MALKAKTRVLVPLAHGFEEIEAITVIDVLRRAGIVVVVAGLRSGGVRGAHDIVVDSDVGLDEVAPDSIDAIVLPGGMPGTLHLREDPRVLEWVRRIDRKRGLTAAICAAPTVLVAAGVTGGHRVTSHPSVSGELAPAEFDGKSRVVRSGHLLTSQGAGSAMEFALALVAELVGPKEAERLGEALLVAPAAPAAAAVEGGKREGAR